MDYFKSFISADLSARPQFPLLRILVEGKGACRHRAFIYVLLCQYLNIPARLVKNDVHAYAEIYNGKEWQTMDLDGSEAVLKNHSAPLNLQPPESLIKKLPEFKKGTAERQSPDLKVIEPEDELLQLPLNTKWIHYFSPVTTIDPSDFKTEQAVIQYIAKQQEPLVIPVESLEKGRGLYQSLAAHARRMDKDLIYIESKEQLDEFLSLIQINDQGKIDYLPGPLRRLLESGGLLVIQWEKFSATEIASLKCLMDKPHPSFPAQHNPKIKPITSISSQFQLINLVTPKTVCVDTFHSRAKHFFWPEQIAHPKPIELAFTEQSLDDKNATAIDVYGDADEWEKILLGDISLGNKGFVFTKGPLFTALKAGKTTVTLIDAPLANPAFQAFIQRLLVQRECIINGEIITIPPDFTVQFATPPLVPQPTNLQNAAELKDQEDQDIFYLNSQTFHLLFRQSLIKDSKIAAGPGWLAMPGKYKRIIQTGPLSAGELRRLYAACSEQGQQTFYWQDISKDFLKKPTDLPTLNLDAFKDKKSAFIQTSDPQFVAKLLEKKDTLSLLISAQIDSNHLIELVTQKNREEKELQELRFTQQKQAVAEALIAGKTVILHGQLSAELYSALETLFADPPQIKFSANEKAQTVPGQLIVVTKPLPFATVVPQYYGNTFSVPQETLWQAYRDAIPKKDHDLLNKIQQFYTLAAIIPHGRIGMPLLPHLSLERLQGMLNILKSKDYSFKSLFHYDYDKESEEYARLNVYAKKLFGEQDEKDQKPGVRLYKLNPYPDDAAHAWRRMNCFNGTALQTLKGFDENTIQTFLKEFPSNKKNYEPIQQNSDPQAKLSERVRAVLAKENGVVLKGPPGSGKTFFALAYANAPEHKAFFGEEALSTFLKKPQPGKESVLILDEANLAVPGHWDYLYPLLQHRTDGQPRSITFKGHTYELTNQHKVIFTCNPEHYAGREHHALLQDLPTFYVKSWTADSLQKYLITPLIKQLSPKANPSPLELNQLIQVYELGKQSLPKGTVSLRELNQLVCRWLYYKNHGKTKEALYYAALREWSSCFSTDAQQQDFKAKLEKLLAISAQTPTPALALEKMLLAKRPKGYFLCNKLKQLLTGVYEDLQLSQTWQDQSSIDKAPLVKSGVLIEGASGVGKSAAMRMLLSHVLQLKEYKPEALLTTEETDLSHAFIQFTVSGNLEQDARILRAAFDKGCKVILDELNLGPDLEGLLNHLLTGHTPEGTYAKQKGFFIFASQNDNRTVGTLSLSKALVNRLHVYKPEPYTKEDLLELSHDALPVLRTEERMEIVDAYLYQKEKYPHYINARTYLEGLQDIQKEYPYSMDPYVKDIFGQTALFVAAEQGQTACVKALLESKANVNHKDNGGTSAMPLAVRSGKAEIVKLLFEYKAEVANSRWSGLIEAAENGHLEIVKELLAHKANINEQRPCDGNTALMQAMRYGYHSGDRRIEDLILANKPNVNLEDSNRNTALSLYASREEGKYVEKVLKLKADVNHQDKYGHTPLFWAHYWRRNDIVELLTQAKKEQESSLSSGSTNQINLKLKESSDKSPVHIGKLKMKGDEKETILQKDVTAGKPTVRAISSTAQVALVSGKLTPYK